MIILGIDPGYGKCGWAILSKAEKFKIEDFPRLELGTRVRFKNDELISNTKSKIINHKSEIELVACDCIETDSKKDLPNRLKEIYDGIEYIIKKYQPTELAIENLFFFKNQKTVMQVSQARGAIIIAAKNHHLDIYEYTPLQVKQAVVGYGRADKSQIQKMIKLHLCGQNLPKQDDTADAVAVGLTHLQTSRICQSRIVPEYHESIHHESSRKISNIRDNFGKIRDKELVNNSHLIYPELSYKINGILFRVYNELGHGYQEKYYYKPIEMELEREHIPYQKQKKVELYYKGVDLGRYFIDYVIDNKIVLEIKVNPYFSQRDIKQVLAYLERNKLELSILASFTKNGVKLKRITRGYNN